MLPITLVEHFVVILKGVVLEEAPGLGSGAIPAVFSHGFNLSAKELPGTGSDVDVDFSVLVEQYGVPTVVVVGSGAPATVGYFSSFSS